MLKTEFRIHRFRGGIKKLEHTGIYRELRKVIIQFTGLKIAFGSEIVVRTLLKGIGSKALVIILNGRSRNI